jgi:hypothetical protein
VTSKDPQQAPDSASFVADPNGEADFQGRVDGCLLDAVKLVFVLIYHFDGLTYGSLATARRHPAGMPAGSKQPIRITRPLR